MKDSQSRKPASQTVSETETGESQMQSQSQTASTSARRQSRKLRAGRFAVAAVSLALAVSSVLPETLPYLRPIGTNGNVAIVMSDGKLVQPEFLHYHVANSLGFGYCIWYEDGSINSEC